MDHLKAMATKATERYLLGEMSEPERFEFEDHYFQCEECAEDVRAADALMRGVQAVGGEIRKPRKETTTRTGWLWGWFTPAAGLATAAACLLAGMVAYQNFVTIPGWRASRAVSPLVLRAEMRGEEPVVAAVAGQPYVVFSLDVNAAEPGSVLLYELGPRGGAARTNGRAAAPAPGSPLLIVVSTADLPSGGPWNLILRNPQGKELANYPFQLQTR